MARWEQEKVKPQRITFLLPPALVTALYEAAEDEKTSPTALVEKGLRAILPKKTTKAAVGE